MARRRSLRAELAGLVTRVGYIPAWLSTRQLRCATAVPQPPAATLLPEVGSGVGWGPYRGPEVIGRAIVVRP